MWKQNGHMCVHCAHKYTVKCLFHISTHISCSTSIPHEGIFQHQAPCCMLAKIMRLSLLMTVHLDNQIPGKAFQTFGVRVLLRTHSIISALRDVGIEKSLSMPACADFTLETISNPWCSEGIKQCERGDCSEEGSGIEPGGDVHDDCARK